MSGWIGEAGRAHTLVVSFLMTWPGGDQRLYCCFIAKSYPTLLQTPWTVACQTPLSRAFPKQEYWSGLPFPSSGDLPDPGIKPVSPALQADSLPLNHQGSSMVPLDKRITRDKKGSSQEHEVFSSRRYLAYSSEGHGQPLWPGPRGGA